jgi:hypothetical protein
MIGEKIAELTGRTTLRRVVGHPDEPKMEVSMEQTGKVLGVDVMDVATYESIAEPGGYLRGQGQGIGMTKDGERITWTGSGVGRPTAKGFQWRGSIQYKTSSTKLARLNGHCFVFEYDLDEAGHSQARIYEWK